MKFIKQNILYKIVLFICFLLLNNTSLRSQCDAKQVARIAKVNIEKPYLYSNSDFQPIVFDVQNEKKINMEFVAFKDLKYRIIFCSSNFEEKVIVKVYAKNKDNKNNKKVFDSSESMDNNFWIFVPPNQGKYNIEYTISKSSTGEEKDGCIIMVSGFSDQ